MIPIFVIHIIIPMFIQQIRGWFNKTSSRMKLGNYWELLSANFIRMQIENLLREKVTRVIPISSIYFLEITESFRKESK